MGRPRKNTVSAAAPAAALPLAETVAAPIVFDDDGGDAGGDARGDAGEEEVEVEVQAPPLAAAATPPAADLTAFIREMQMLRQVMVQQRDEIDQLKSSLYSNQQARVSEQSNALAMHEKVQQLSEQLLLARTMPPVSSSAKEAPPLPPPPALSQSQSLQRQASQPAYPAAPVFRTTPPRMPMQDSEATARAAGSGGANPHARLGLINDLPNMRKSRQNHVAELQTGSRYIVKGTNGLS